LKTTEEIYSVSRLTGIIRGLIEDGLPSVWVEGELSNYTLHKSGHRYFTLKDAAAQINCVMWRTRPEPGFKLREGLQVRAFGKVRVWEQGGRYQLDIQSILPAGLGALQAAFEELKRKLADEGLFDTERKRPLPKYPQAIGIVTSPTGAAIRDLVWGFSSRFPAVDIYLLPVKVQGEGAAEEISRAIGNFNRSGLVDIIVIGRGGGSLEDLWAFNEEVVVRAVAASELPVVSAVGHEVDVTLSDLAADLRAPTPTAAATLIVPDRADLIESLKERSTQFARSLSRTISLWRERVSNLSNSYGMKQVVNRVSGERMRIDEIAEKHEHALVRKISDYKRMIDALSGRFTALSPSSVLERGYCVARMDEGSVVKDATSLSTGDKLNLTFKHGGALTTVEEIRLNDKK